MSTSRFSKLGFIVLLLATLLVVLMTYMNAFAADIVLAESSGNDDQNISALAFPTFDYINKFVAADDSAITTGTITGRVTDESNQPVEGVWVSVFKYEGGGIEETGVATDKDGYYTIADIEPGDYRITFSPPDDLYLQLEFFDNQKVWQEASKTTVAAGSIVTANAILEPGGRISGVVRDTSETPLSNIEISVYPVLPDRSDDLTRQPRLTYTAGDGTYEVASLAPGKYLIAFYAPDGSIYENEFLDNARYIADATLVDVAAKQDASGKNAILDIQTHPALPVIEGITDPINIQNQSSVEVTGTSEPGSYVEISLTDKDGYSVSTETVTDANGEFIARIGFDLISDLKDGAIEATAIAVDEIGNISDDSLPRPAVKDTAAPVTTISLAGTAGNNGWYKSNVTVTLSFTDNTGVPRIETVQYKLNNETAWRPYGGAFTISAEGETTVYYRSIDRAGNVEATKQQLVKIDKTSPSVSITAPVGTYVTDNTPLITYTVTPSNATVVVKVDGSVVNKVSGNSLDTLSQGSHTLRVEATDVAGHFAYHQVNFTVDTMAPTTPSPTATRLSNGNLRVSWNASTDAGSGQKHYLIRVNGVDKPAQTGTSYEFAPASGTNTVYVKAVDNIGNTSAAGVISATVTLTGSNIATTVQPDGSAAVTVSFSSVTAAGATSVSVSSSSSAGTPSGFNLLGLYYEIRTTAVRSGTVTITLPYSDAGMTVEQEQALKLYHYEGGAWKDITKSIDTSANIITAEASSLSPFAVMKRASQSSPGGGNSWDTPPLAPIGLKSTPNQTFIQLVWNPNRESDLAGYNVYRKSGSVVTKLNKTLIVNVVQYQDTPPEASKTYTYYVTAVDKTGNESTPSNSIEASMVIVKAAIVFADVPANAWFKDAVSKLIAKNIIGGFSDGSFRPYGRVTRAEFAKMLCLAKGWSLVDPAQASFGDVSKGHWAYKYIETAKAYGAISGYPNGNFRPNGNITRAEIAKMMYTTLNLPSGSSKLLDIKSSWARGYIDACVRAGIIKGYTDGTFKPNNSTSRAEAAKIIASLI